jgi:hypothetical protein
VTAWAGRRGKWPGEGANGRLVDAGITIRPYLSTRMFLLRARFLFVIALCACYPDADNLRREPGRTDPATNPPPPGGTGGMGTTSPPTGSGGRGGGMGGAPGSGGTAAPPATGGTSGGAAGSGGAGMPATGGRAGTGGSGAGGVTGAGGSRDAGGLPDLNLPDIPAVIDTILPAPPDASDGGDGG